VIAVVIKKRLRGIIITIYVQVVDLLSLISRSDRPSDSQTDEEVIRFISPHLLQQYHIPVQSDRVLAESIPLKLLEVPT
jgi:hypothetical protein